MNMAKGIWLDEVGGDIPPAMWARLAKHISSMSFVLLPHKEQAEFMASEHPSFPAGHGSLRA